MSNKLFASAPVAPDKDGSADKSREALPADQPTVRPGQKPAAVAPVSKS